MEGIGGGEREQLSASCFGEGRLEASAALLPTIRPEREPTIWQILLVGKHQQQALLHFPVVQDLMQLSPCLLDTLPVLRVDDEDEALRAGVVVSPERTNLVLSSHVLMGEGVREDGLAKRRGRRVAEGRKGETDPNVEPGRARRAGAWSVEL